MANDFLNSLGDTIAKQLNLNSEKEVSGLVEALFGKVLTKLSGTKSSFIAKPTDPTKDPVVKELKTANKTLESLKSILKESAVDSIQSSKSVLEKDKDVSVRIDGVTPEGMQGLQKALPFSFLKDGFSSLMKTNSQLAKALDGLGGKIKSGLGWGAMGLIATLFSAFMFLDGLADSGPFKGLKKILAKLGASIATLSFTKLFSGIWAGIEGIGELLGFFEKAGGEAVVKTGAKDAAKAGLTKLIPTFLKGVFQFVKRLPIIGMLISLGFAAKRFWDGDMVGGGIDVLSALSGLLYLVPGIGPALAISIGLGLDALNAVLDYKAGGSSPEASKKKWDLLKQWGTAIAKKLYDTFKDAPVIGHVMKAGKAFKDGEYIKGLGELAKVNPGQGLIEIIDWIFGTNIQKETAIKTQTNFIDPFKTLSEKLGKKWDEWKKGIFEWFGEVGSSIKKYTWDLPAQKMGEIEDGFKAASEGFSKKWSEWKEGIFGWFKEVGSSIKKYTWDLPGEKLDDLFDAFKGITEIFSKKWNEWKDMAGKWAGAVKDKVSGWWNGATSALGLGDKKEETKIKSKEEPARDIRSVKEVNDAVINPKGGLVISSPKEGALFQLSKKDGIVAAPFADNESKLLGKGGLDSRLTMQALTKVASNTGDTTTALYNLLRGFDNLAKQMNQFAQIVASQGKGNSSPIIIGNNQQNATSTQVVDGLVTPIPGFRSMIEGSRFAAV